jgi:hypothetical protein
MAFLCLQRNPGGPVLRRKRSLDDVDAYVSSFHKIHLKIYHKMYFTAIDCNSCPHILFST